MVGASGGGVGSDLFAISLANCGAAVLVPVNLNTEPERTPLA